MRSVQHSLMTPHMRTTKSQKLIKVIVGAVAQCKKWMCPKKGNPENHWCPLPFPGHSKRVSKSGLSQVIAEKKQTELL